MRKFAAKHKRDSRMNPTHCLKIQRGIYGNPSAGHAFEMLLRGAHVKGAKMTQSDLEPSIYIRILVDENDVVTDYVVAYVYVDDCNYFGTDRLRLMYEEEIAEQLKVKFQGPCKRFVGVETDQDLERGLFEMKLPECWVKAAELYKKHFPNGLKSRGTPLAVADERILNLEVTDADFEEAKHLPYRELLGTVSYPAACVKLEMRYCVSVLGRFRGKWGLALLLSRSPFLLAFSFSPLTFPLPPSFSPASPVLSSPLHSSSLLFISLLFSPFPPLPSSPLFSTTPSPLPSPPPLSCFR